MSLWDKMPKSISRTDDSICFALIPSLLNDLHHTEGNGRVTRPLLTRCNVNCKVAIPPEHRLNHQVWRGFWRGRLNNSISCACYVTGYSRFTYPNFPPLPPWPRFFLTRRRLSNQNRNAASSTSLSLTLPTSINAWFLPTTNKWWRQGMLLIKSVREWAVKRLWQAYLVVRVT